MGIVLEDLEDLDALERALNDLPDCPFALPSSLGETDAGAATGLEGPAGAGSGSMGTGMEGRVACVSVGSASSSPPSLETASTSELPDDSWRRVEINKENLYATFSEVLQKIQSEKFFLGSTRTLGTWVLKLQKIEDTLYFKFKEKIILSASASASASASVDKGKSVPPQILGEGAFGEVILQEKKKGPLLAETLRAKKEFFDEVWCSVSVPRRVSLSSFERTVSNSLREFFLFLALYGKDGEICRYAFDPFKGEFLGRIRMTFTLLEGASLYSSSIEDFASWAWLFGQACCQIASLHRLKAAHLDVKLDNMLLDDEGRLYIVDYGSALFEEELEAAKAIPKTTPWYRPLESFRNRGRDQRHGYSTDVYSVACSFLNKEGLCVGRFFDKNGNFVQTESEFSERLQNFLNNTFQRFMALSTGFIPEAQRNSEALSVCFLLNKMMEPDSKDRLPPPYLLAVGKYFENLSTYLIAVQRSFPDPLLASASGDSVPEFSGLPEELLEYRERVIKSLGSSGEASLCFAQKGGVEAVPGRRPPTPFPGESLG
jgi:serine/threonine protein kinase